MEHLLILGRKTLKVRALKQNSVGLQVEWFKQTNIMCIKHSRSDSQCAGVQEYRAGGKDSGGADQKSEDSQQGQTQGEAAKQKKRMHENQNPPTFWKHSSCGCDKDSSSVSGEGLHLFKLSQLGIGIRNWIQEVDARQWGMYKLNSFSPDR